MFKAWALAVIVQMAGVTLLSGLGYMPISVPPFWWAANIAGGLMFGVGMVLAGGCSSGTCYRVGEGMAGSVLALTGFGLGILLADRGALAPVEQFLRADIVSVGGDQATLANIIGINPMWVGWRSPPPWAFGCGGAGQAIADTPVAVGRGTFRGSPWAPSASPRGSVHRLWAGNSVCP